MRHLLRILQVAVPVVIAAGSTALATPAVTNFLAAHPADAGYVLLVAGVLRAAYKVLKDNRAGVQVPAPPSAGSSMGAK